MAMCKFNTLISCLLYIVVLHQIHAVQHPLYVFSFGNYICSYNVSTSDLNVTIDLDHSCLFGFPSDTAHVLDMNFQENLVYLATDGNIHQLEYTAEITDKDKLLLYSAADIISDISVDWITGNIFFTASEINAIKVAGSDGKHPLVLLDNIDGIFGVAVDPINRLIFWTNTLSDGFEYHIGRANLDGSERDDHFFTEANKPYYLVLDHWEKMLYWTSRNSITGYIQVISIDGTGHRIIYEDNLAFPYSITVYQDHVIWVDELFEIVYWTEKVSGNHTQYDDLFSFDNPGEIQDIMVFGDYSQPRGHQNGCSSNKGGCQHLCLPTSDTEVKCVCSLGYSLADDNKACEPGVRGALAHSLIVGDTGLMEIFFLDADTQQLAALPVTLNKDVSDVAVDPLLRQVFWSDVVDDTINYAAWDGTGFTTVKSFANGHSITGLAVDYLKQLIFYGDLQTGVLASITYDGSTTRTILDENDTIALVPDLANERLFVAIRGYDSRILRIPYEAENAESSTVLVSANIYRLSTLAVDFGAREMFWVDSYTDKMEMSDLDGNNRKTIVPNTANSYIASMAVLDEFIYFCDRVSNNQLVRLDRRNNYNAEQFGPNEFLHCTAVETFPTYMVPDLTTRTRPTMPTTAPFEKHPLYVFSLGNRICSYDITSSDLHPSQDIEHSCLFSFPSTTPHVIDMNFAEYVIYLATDGNIHQLEYTSEITEKDLLIMFSAGHEITDIAVDWITGNIYFVDRYENAIKAIPHDGKYIYTILEDIQGVFGMAVDPINRYIFWTTDGSNTEQYMIGRANLDGSNRNDAWYIEQGSVPYYIVIDFWENKVYWTVQKKTSTSGAIKCNNLDGTAHQVIFESNDTLPYSLTVYRDHVVFVDIFDSETVRWIEKDTGNHAQSNEVFSVDFFGRKEYIQDIILFGNYSQPSGYQNGCSGNKGGCTQLCFPTSATAVQCRCSLGYVLGSDNKQCVSETPSPEVLYNSIVVADSGLGAIYFMNSDTFQLSAIPMPHQPDVTDIAVDPLHSKVFWADVVSGSLMSASYDGEVTTIKTFPNGHSILAMAVDYVKELIFFGDSDTGVLASTKYDGTATKTILAENNTYAIVPDMQNEKLYIALIGYLSRIISIPYDATSASDSTVLVFSNVYAPRSLAIDFEGKKMYWADANLRHIEMSDLDGNNRRVIVTYTGDTLLTQMSVKGNYIYISDWQFNNQLVRLNGNKNYSVEYFGTNKFTHTTAVEAYPTYMVPVPPTTPGNIGVNDQQGGDRSSSPSKTGGIAGGVVAAIVAVVVVVVIAACYAKRRKPKPITDYEHFPENQFENPGYASSNPSAPPPGTNINMAGGAVGYTKDPAGPEGPVVVPGDPNAGYTDLSFATSGDTKS